MEKVLQTDIVREPKTLYFCKGNPIAIYKVKPGRAKQNKELEMEKLEKDIANTKQQ